ncbi:MAG TPA: type VI secretion system tip protein TssI/VgrG [Caulobacteraceae bacterium]|jgi:type VI secretion system secreted protein VgrG|nr:type VI secretion system tip protein TssI/VgrG [Caulobacteraceae bacterium]
MPSADTREAKIKFDATGPKLSLRRFDAVERLSELFVIHVQVSCDTETDFYPHLGKTLTISVDDNSGEPLRYYNGCLFEVDFVDVSGASFNYNLTLRPWFFYLTRNVDYRVYQDLNAVDVIKNLLDKRSIAYTKFDKLQDQTVTRGYRVQYRESDFAFISRVMEEEGIYYYFRHADGEHEMVLCNARASHPDSKYPTLPVIPPTGGALPNEDHVDSWLERVSSSGELKSVQRAWYFETPASVDKDFTAAQSTVTTADKAEIFDFPSAALGGDEYKQHDGDSLQTSVATTVINSARREVRIYVGEGDARQLACGDVVRITRHGIKRLNQEYIVVGLRQSLGDQSFRSGGGAGALSMTTVEAIPASQRWAAPLRTPRPVARGPDTAVVVGPSGEVIYTDKFGRVKVQFHWDREGKNDDHSSCWLRVSDGSADASFGHFVLPRIGQEVIVDYLHGDPDRPIVTGRVYNGSHMQAETLPDQKTRSTWRSHTVGDYGKDFDGAKNPAPGVGFNLIGMEDKSGAEVLTLWASRDYKRQVIRDDRTLVNRDQRYFVGRDRTTEIQRNEAKTVDDGDETHTVKTGKRTTSIKMNEQLTVESGDMITKVSEGKQTNEVSMGDQSNKVSMGNKTVEVSMGNMDTTLKMGSYSLKCNLGAVTIEALQSITLKVGASSIVVDQMGVTIKGTMLSNQATVSFQAKGLMSDLEGTAMTTVKGGIVMIN